MSQILKAVDDIKTLASKFRGFIEVAETLEKIGNIEQAEREAKDRAENAKALSVAAESELAKKKERVSKIDEEIDYAKKSADEIVGNANRRAVEIVDAASVKANEAVRSASNHKTEIEKDVADLGRKRQEVITSIREKEKELAEVNAKIAEAKEKVSHLFK